MIKIRKASKSDFKRFWELNLEYCKYNNNYEIIKELKYRLNKSRMKSNFLKNIKKKNHLFLFIEQDNKIIGFLIGQINTFKNPAYVLNLKGIGYLQEIFISLKYRGKGYSRSLINEFLNAKIPPFY